MIQTVRGRTFSLLPRVREKFAQCTGQSITSNVIRVNKHALTSSSRDKKSRHRHHQKVKSLVEADEICRAFEEQHQSSTKSNVADTRSLALQAIEMAFEAYRRLGELYDIDQTRGMRFEPEQDILIRAILASRCTKLAPDEFARHRERLSVTYGLSLFDLYMYVCFPRRRGKSVAIGAVNAIQLSTLPNFRSLVINLSAKLAQQNYIYIRQVFDYLVNDPEHRIKCEFIKGGDSYLFRSHFGTENILNLLANPDRTPLASRGLSGDQLTFDEAQFYGKEGYKGSMPVAQVGSTVVMISSLGSNDNVAAEMANRRHPETKILEFRHYVIQPNTSQMAVSTDEPGEGPPFTYSQHRTRNTRPWYLTQALPAEMVEEYVNKEKIEMRRRFNIMCLSLPAHISLRSFLSLSVIMGENDFNQEMANIGNNEDDASGGSYQAFTQLYIDNMMRRENHVSLAHLGQPYRIITVVDPSGAGDNSRMPVYTFAYYPLPGRVDDKERPDHLMVVRHRAFP